MSLILSGTDGLSDVDGTAATPAIRGTDANTGIFFPAADTIAFAEGGAEVARFDSSGNFGLGVTPYAWTTASGYKSYDQTYAAFYGFSGGTGVAQNATLTSTGWKYRDTLTAQRYEQTGGTHAWYNAASGTAGNAITFTQAMTLSAAGDLLINKTTASGTVGTGQWFLADGRTYATVASSTSAVACWHLYSTTAAAYRFYVGADGVINATNTSIAAISDQRLKENVRDLNVGLAEILALKPRVFDWKEGKGKDTKNDRGFIAQEFEQVFPDLIGEWIDPAPEGEEPYKSLRQDLIPVLVKSIQEQQALITQLTARITALESA